MAEEQVMDEITTEDIRRAMQKLATANYEPGPVFEYGRRILPDGQLLVVYPLTFGRARLVVGPQNVDWYADGW